MNEEELVYKLHDAKSIIIYGAGMVGELVCNRLIVNGLEKKIKCFAVTKQNTDDVYLGFPVVEICSIEDKDAIVLIATFPETHEEMRLTLGKCQLKKYIEITPELYYSLSMHYMQDFQKEHFIKEKNIDILMMASDNNRTSGAFLSMSDLCVELIKLGFSVFVVLPCYGNGENILKERHLNYTYIPSEDWCILKEESDLENKVDKLKINEAAVTSLSEIIKKYHVSLIHNNTTYTYVGAQAGILKDIPVVWHIREDINVQGMSFVNEEESIKLVNRADKIIAISKYISGCYEKFNREKVEIVYNGVDCAKFYEKRGILVNRVVEIIMVGAITEYKGQHQLIEAIGYLKKKGICSFHVNFIGKGDIKYLNYLKDLAEHEGVLEQITFSDRRDDIWNYYRKADFSVVCTTKEGFGRVTIEGMLSGCLVIGSNTGATPEIISDGKTGFLYEQGNSESLGTCILRAIQKKEQSKLIASNGQEYARTHFTKEENARQIAKIYRKVMKNR